MRRIIMITIGLLFSAGAAWSQGIESLEELQNLQAPLQIEKSQFTALADTLTTHPAELMRMQASVHEAADELDEALHANEPDLPLIQAKLANLQSLEGKYHLARIELFLIQRKLLSGKQQQQLRKIKSRKPPVAGPQVLREYNAGFAEPPPPPAQYETAPITVYPEVIR